MKKLFTYLAVGAAVISMAAPAAAQENILAEKPIFTLGDAKTWTADDQSYTFITEDLEKLVAVPTNTSNVYLYPENGTLNTPENQALGAQGFYIDLGSSMDVGTVSTTWEGAAADSYEIYLTDSEPTPAILDTEATFSITGLGQYTQTTAVMPEGARGRYLVFQVTKATNWGWGIKIRSISATAPADDILSTFKVTPGIVVADRSTEMTLTILNQFGVAIPAEDIELTVSANAVYEDGSLIVLSGDYATFTATLGGETIVSTVYVAKAPQVPAATSIKTPIYTNTLTESNPTAEFVTDWNGGASKGGELTFEDGEVAMLFGNARCIFFSNSVTTGAWNGNINPAEEGYRNLCLDVFSGSDTDCTIEFESVENLEGGHTYPFSLTAGEWTPITVDVAGATKLGNLSIRFTEANMADILLANIYFTPAYVEGDETAPVLGEIEAVPSMTGIALTLTATDDLSEDIYYSISDGTNVYSATGKSGEKTEYTITGLKPSTVYNIVVTASDGKNVSAPAYIEVTTTGMPDAPKPTLPEENVIAIYSSFFGATELPAFDAWGSAAGMGTTATESGEEALLFSNYNGQWGGLVNLDLDIIGTDKLYVDIYSDTEGEVTIAPVWGGANGATTPGYKLELTDPGMWASFTIELGQFDYDLYGTEVIQIALTDSTLPSFAIDNLYFGSEKSLGISSAEYASQPQDKNIYNLQGIRVGTDIEALPAGLYIFNGKKVLKK